MIEKDSGDDGELKSSQNEILNNFLDYLTVFTFQYAFGLSMYQCFLFHLKNYIPQILSNTKLQLSVQQGKC